MSYRKLQLYAIAISIISVIYNAGEGAVSIVFGAESSSKSLVFFGIQSGVEVASALIVLWRFRAVAKPGEERKAKLQPHHLRFEKIATLSIGILLILLGLGTISTAISTLVLHEKPETSNASLIISATALVLMVLIWLPKRYLARELNSSTMEGEATCSLSCIQITIVLFIGSLIYRVWKGGWWIDGATSIVLGILFGWEGVKMVRWARNPGFDGGCCGSCKKNENADDGSDLEEAKNSQSCFDKCEVKTKNSPMCCDKEESKCCTVLEKEPQQKSPEKCGDGCCDSDDDNVEEEPVTQDIICTKDSSCCAGNKED